MFSYTTYWSHCDVGTGFVTFAGGAQNLSVTFCHVALSGRRNSDVTSGPNSAHPPVTEACARRAVLVDRYDAHPSCILLMH